MAVVISLPKAQPPPWFVPRIVVPKNANVIVLDDDPSIHQIWDQRFSPFKETNKHFGVFHFSSSGDLVRWHKDSQRNHNIYLIDHELIPDQKNGIQLIKSLGIRHQSILVTSLDEDETIKATCIDNQIRLIPKSMACFVPISTQDETPYDCVLIDDDPYLREAWHLSAKDKNIRILTSNSISDFWKKSHTLSKNTPIYIDSDLGNGIKGEEEAQELFKAGFKELYLTTGKNMTEGQIPHWIKEMVTKYPPWISDASLPS